MSSVLDQAQNFSGGVVSAARKRESWLRRAANATDPEVAEQYREAAADLAARYPDIEGLEPGEAERFARERGHGRKSRSPVHQGRSRTRPGTTRRASTRPSSSKPKSPAKSRGGLEATRRAGPQPTPKVDRAIAETGVPAAANSGRSSVLGALGATAGLSLLYLLLSSAEQPGSGGAALPQAIGAVTGFLHRFIGTGDFFPSNGPKTERFTARRAGGGKPSTVTYAGPQTVKTAAGRLKAMEERQKQHRKEKR